MDYINQAWAWIEANVMPFLTAANLAAVLSVIAVLVRQKHTIRDNTSSSKELKTMLRETRDNNAETAEIKALVSDTADQLSVLTEKLDALLDVERVAWNALKSPSEDAKSAINNLVTNARYANGQARADIIRKMENLKTELASLTERQSKVADKVVKLAGGESETQSESLINFARLKRGGKNETDEKESPV